MASTHGTTRALTTVAWLRSRIGSGEWPIDSKIPTEPQLVALLKVGRSTVREAVRTLANEGMLETAPGRGTFVRARSPVNTVLAEYLAEQTLDDLLQFRRGLESEAAALAASRRTDDDIRRLRERLLELPSAAPASRTSTAPGDFHADLFEISGNSLLNDMFRSVIRALRAQIQTGALVLAEPGERHADHEEIFVSICAGDAVAARRAAERHCSRDISVAAAASAS